MSLRAEQAYPRRNVVMVTLVAASLINILPLLLFYVGGDIYSQLPAISCFSKEFWQGDFYPRWCMSANAGLGSPLFLFYSPLAYYVTALFYPLTSLGLTMDGLYTVSVWLATLATGMTCYLWLKDIVSWKCALLASLFFLFFPYRLEALFFRSALAETWFIALLPLLCLYARKMVRGEKQTTAAIAAIAALMILTNLACAAVALLLCGLYILIMAGKTWQPLAHYLLSAVWGVALSAFYVLTGIYYRRFIAVPALFDLKDGYGWSNTYLSLRNITGLSQGRVVVIIALTIVLLIGFSIFMLHRRQLIPERFIRHECGAWTGTAAVALYLLFPISAPFYFVMGPIAQIVYPWRMQMAFMLCLTFLMAAWLQWCISPRQMNTWKGNYAVLLACMAMTSYVMLSIRDPSALELGQRTIQAGMMIGETLRTPWLDKEHNTQDYVLAQYANKDFAQSAQVIAGKGTVTVDRWKWNGIVLRTSAKKEIQIRLAHRYFPIWAAQTETGQVLALSAEQGSGQMLLNIPAGNHDVTLTYTITRPDPALLWGFNMISIVAMLLWLQYMIGPICKRRRTLSQ